jgi:hypothetical protein
MSSHVIYRLRKLNAYPVADIQDTIRLIIAGRIIGTSRKIESRGQQNDNDA